MKRTISWMNLTREKYERKVWISPTIPLSGLCLIIHDVRMRLCHLRALSCTFPVSQMFQCKRFTKVDSAPADQSYYYYYCSYHNHSPSFIVIYLVRRGEVVQSSGWAMEVGILLTGRMHHNLSKGETLRKPPETGKVIDGMIGRLVDWVSNTEHPRMVEMYWCLMLWSFDVLMLWMRDDRYSSSRHVAVRIHATNTFHEVL